LVDIVARDLGIELASATNQFVFDAADKLVDIIAPDDDTHIKLHHLQSFCTLLGIDIKECACIGDGDNDIEMFRATGKGITFKGSKIESEAWKVVESFTDLQTSL
jgi:phosphoserine phosphatase